MMVGLQVFIITKNASSPISNHSHIQARRFRILLQVSFLENHNLDPLQSLISDNNHISVASAWGMKKK